jgi:putative ABC transport system ATP-binding protein
MIKASHATLTYLDHGKAIHACNDVVLEVREGEFLGILGPSGSGKSSLLYLLSGLKDPTSGAITLDGSPISGMDEVGRSAMRLSTFGFVFQQPFLLGYLTALENVMLAARETDEAAARDMLGRLSIAEKAHRLPHELSGGEKQRVCVARALIGDPRVVFADEPTASLDHQTGEQVVSLLASNRKGALVMVTHDPSMLRDADRIVRIDSGVVTEDSSVGRGL